MKRGAINAKAPFADTTKSAGRQRVQGRFEADPVLTPESSAAKVLKPFLSQFLQQLLLTLGHFLGDLDQDLDQLVAFSFAAQ
jgi:hypothetical protein